MQKSALILVDMQNSFCSRQGSFWKRGYSILDLEEVLARVELLLSFSHQTNLFVIFTKLEYHPDYSDSGLLVKEIAPQIVTLGGYIKDTWDSELYAFRNRTPDDLVIVKKRYDPFIDTELDNILRGNFITHLFIAGLLTNVCVESTARSAFDRDYRITVVGDVTATYSVQAKEQSLSTIQKHFGTIASLDELRTTPMEDQSRLVSGRETTK